jgi:DNA repair protein RecO
MEMVPEGEPQYEIFLLLNETLRQLSEDKDPLNVVLLFIFRFLDLSGYLPSLENCNVCGRPLKSCTQWWWRMQQGTLACTEHRTIQEQCIMLDLGTLILIRQLRDLPVDKVWRLRLLQEKKAPLLQGVLDWVRHHIRRDLKSLKLLEQVHTVQMAAQ